MESKNSEAMATLLNKKIAIRQFPEEVVEELRRLTVEVLDEMTAKDVFSRKVYTSYQDFQKKAGKYAQITERMFYNALQPG